MAGGQLYIPKQDDASASNAVADAMAALGIYCEETVDVEDDEFWLWPENEDAFHLWLSLQTQWVIGMAGPTGLNYVGVEACMRMRGMRRKQQQEFFSLIQAMEQSALDEWSSKR